MTEADLKKITTTIDGYEVKALRWLPTDNVITGLVKDPETGNPRLHEGFVSGVWRKDGTPVKRIAGRTDLKLNMDSKTVSKIDSWTEKAVNKVYMAMFDEAGIGQTLEQKKERLKIEERKYEKQF